jgi:hypothetical protein
MSDLELFQHTDLLNKVGNLWLSGTKDPSKISKQLKITRVDAMDLIEEWKSVILSDKDVKERAKEALHEFDKSNDKIVAELWVIAEESNDFKIRNTALKSISDIQARHLELFQKAGLYDDSVLADELAANEEKFQIIAEILRDVTSRCPNCRLEVARRLSDATGQTEGVPTNVIDVEVVSD